MTSVILLFISTLIALYLSALMKYLDKTIPDGNCPSYFDLNYKNPELPSYKLKVLQDYAYRTEDE
jgi:hypothetical protein